jgi:hypothetical protein
MSSPDQQLFPDAMTIDRRYRHYNPAALLTLQFIFRPNV